jgi:hypothetical protein
LHQDTPLDFAILGGDNIDNTQSNELDWLQTLLKGGVVECDSGDDDSAPEKAPFLAEGLAVQTHWVSPAVSQGTKSSVPAVTG